MLRHNPSDDFLFDPLFPLRLPQLGLSVGGDPPFSPLFHSRRIHIHKSTTRCFSVNQRKEFYVVIRQGEIEYSQTRIPFLILGRLNDPAKQFNDLLLRYSYGRTGES